MNMLSPAAQATLKAWCQAHSWEADVPPSVGHGLAEVLRTLADQVVPQAEVSPQENLECRREAMVWGMNNQTQLIRHAILSIAAELNEPFIKHKENG